MPRSMAVKQEQVDGLTTPRNKACSFHRASKSFRRSRDVHSGVAFLGNESTTEGRGSTAYSPTAFIRDINSMLSLLISPLIPIRCFLIAPPSHSTISSQFSFSRSNGNGNGNPLLEISKHHHYSSPYLSVYSARTTFKTRQTIWG